MPGPSGSGVYGKRMSGSGAGEILTRITGEKVKLATDEECRLRVQELISDLKNSSKRLTIEEFSKKHRDTFDDMNNITDDPETREEYRRQLDAERRRRMKIAEKKKRRDEKEKKKLKKKKRRKKRKKDAHGASSAAADDDDDSDDEEALLQSHLGVAAREPVVASAARPIGERDTAVPAQIPAQTGSVAVDVDEQVEAAVQAANILARRARMRRPDARARLRESIWAPDPGEDEDK
uniref:Uncharacterized protein n=1 Tax=Lotharella oceanica TaxID=641309 RepID=A0A7S2X8D6_9EUKA|mmetsp:Transcript_19257/g.36237  ORF Transcript_19257/g.36237 Transcript_19257/m.36237 type:complete len:236 (+) Transcript_19257:64-771(+)